MNRITTLQKLGKLTKQPRKEITGQLDTVTREVRERIGTNVEILLPVRNPDHPGITQALVDVSQLLAIIQLAGAWADRSKKFWDVMEKEKMDKKLIPDDLSDNPVTAQNLAANLSDVQKILVAKDISVEGQGKCSVTDNPDELEEFPDIELEPISPAEVLQTTRSEHGTALTRTQPYHQMKNRLQPYEKETKEHTTKMR